MAGAGLDIDARRPTHGQSLVAGHRAAPLRAQLSGHAAPATASAIEGIGLQVGAAVVATGLSGRAAANATLTVLAADAGTTAGAAVALVIGQVHTDRSAAVAPTGRQRFGAQHRRRGVGQAGGIDRRGNRGRRRGGDAGDDRGRRDRRASRLAGAGGRGCGSWGRRPPADESGRSEATGRPPGFSPLVSVPQPAAASVMTTNIGIGEGANQPRIRTSWRGHVPVAGRTTNDRSVRAIHRSGQNAPVSECIRSRPGRITVRARCRER